MVASCAPAQVIEKVVTATPAPKGPEKPFRIAVIFPSAITDSAFSQALYEALMKVQKEMGKDKLEIVYSENMPKVPDAAAAIRDYASKGYNLVIAHGAVIGTSLPQIAPDFPNTSFAWGSSLDTFQSKGINNVFAYEVEAQQGGYVLGTIAALTSKSGIIGICGPVETGDAKLFVDGFKFGAKVTKPEVKVNVSYTGSFSDVSMMAAAAETHIKAGADIITGSSQSAVGALGVAKDKKVLWMCSQWDQFALAPEQVVACQIYEFTGVIKDIIAIHKAGVMGGKVYTMTLKNGGLSILYNDKIQLSTDVKVAAEAAIKGIKNDTIKPLP